VDNPAPRSSSTLFTGFDVQGSEATSYDTNAPFNKINDWGFRADAFSDYKSGFEIRTTRLCNRVLLFHNFSELPGGPALVKSVNFEYDTNQQQGFTFLKPITPIGYIKKTGWQLHTEKPACD
jgi:hypothetical protein